MDSYPNKFKINFHSAIYFEFPRNYDFSSTYLSVRPSRGACTYDLCFVIFEETYFISGWNNGHSLEYLTTVQSMFEIQLQRLKFALIINLKPWPAIMQNGFISSTHCKCRIIYTLVLTKINQLSYKKIL